MQVNQEQSTVGKFVSRSRRSVTCSRIHKGLALSLPVFSVFHCGMTVDKYFGRDVYSGLFLNHNHKSDQLEQRKLKSLRIKEFANFRENELCE